MRGSHGLQPLRLRIGLIGDGLRAEILYSRFHFEALQFATELFVATLGRLLVASMRRSMPLEESATEKSKGSGMITRL